MKKILALVFLINFQCSEKKESIKSEEWVIEHSDRSVSPYSFIRYDKKGTRVFDSTMFFTGSGYKVCRYVNGLIIETITKLDNSKPDTIKQAYDDHHNLISVNYRNSEGASRLQFYNKYDVNGNLVESKTRQSNDTALVGIAKKYYSESKLDSERIVTLISLHGSIKKIVITRKFSELNGLDIKVEKNFNLRFIDSTVVDPKSATTIKFRKPFGMKYEFVSKEMYVGKDSATLEITNKFSGTLVAKRSSVEYW